MDEDVPSFPSALLVEAHHAVLIHFFFHGLIETSHSTAWRFCGMFMTPYDTKTHALQMDHLEYQIIPNHIQLVESIILSHSNDVNIEYLSMSKLYNK